MTNNTQLVSVPRELLEAVTAYSGSFHPMEPARAKLRALLAAPAEDVRAVVEEPVISSAGDAWLWHELRVKHGDGSGQEEGFYAGWADCLRSRS